MSIYDKILICINLFGLIYFTFYERDMPSANFCFLTIIAIYIIHIKNKIDNLKK